MFLRRSHAYFTPEDYLELERLSPIKHEYLQGQVVAMAGASKAHVIITGNLFSLLLNHLRPTGCLVYTTDMKVRVTARNTFYYPDLAVTCDDRDRDAGEDFIQYPKAIVEILSDTTATFDRGDKFADYQTIDTLEDYILVHQNQPLVEHFSRQRDRFRSPQVYREGDRLEIASLNFQCPIETLYENCDRLR